MMAKRKRKPARKPAAARKSAAGSRSAKGGARKAPKKRQRRLKLTTSPREVVEVDSREVVRGWQRTTVNYQLERVTCGQRTCKSCPHGPYWYAYHQNGDGRKVSRYIGKRFRLLTAEEVFDG